MLTLDIRNNVIDIDAPEWEVVLVGPTEDHPTWIRLVVPTLRRGDSVRLVGPHGHVVRRHDRDPGNVPIQSIELPKLGLGDVLIIHIKDRTVFVHGLRKGRVSFEAADVVQFTRRGVAASS